MPGVGTSLVDQGVKTLPSNAGAMSSITDQGVKSPHALWPKKPKQK